MKHGRVRYSKRGCRCFTCRVGHARYQQSYRAGKRLMTDTQTARAIVEMLLDQGATIEWIAASSGLCRPTVSYLHNRRTDRVRSTTVAALRDLAERVGNGDTRPPGYAEATRRKGNRERKRNQRSTT